MSAQAQAEPPLSQAAASSSLWACRAAADAPQLGARGLAPGPSSRGRTVWQPRCSGSARAALARPCAPPLPLPCTYTWSTQRLAAPASSSRRPPRPSRPMERGASRAAPRALCGPTAAAGLCLGTLASAAATSRSANAAQSAERRCRDPMPMACIGERRTSGCAASTEVCWVG